MQSSTIACRHFVFNCLNNIKSKLIKTV